MFRRLSGGLDLLIRSVIKLIHFHTKAKGGLQLFTQIVTLIPSGVSHDSEATEYASKTNSLYSEALQKV